MRQRIVDRLKEASRLSAVRRRALARPEGAARRHRDLDDRRVLPVAAARVPARGRRRSRLRPRRRHRGAAADRRVARSGAADLPRHRARRRRRGAGVRAARRAAAARRLAALLDRRLVAPQALRRFLRSGPRDLTAAAACRAAADAAARRSSPASAAASTLFLNDGPVPPSAVRDAGGRHRARWCDRRSRRPLDAARRTGGVPRAGRSAARATS